MLGVALAMGILMMVVDEGLGTLIVGVAGVSVAGIYLLRIIKSIKDRRETIYCCFSGINNVTMILSVAGMLMLMFMLMDAFHRPVFYFVITLLVIAMIANAVLLKYNIRGMMHITAQIRLMIALIVLVVFFLL